MTDQLRVDRGKVIELIKEGDVGADILRKLFADQLGSVVPDGSYAVIITKIPKRYDTHRVLILTDNQEGWALNEYDSYLNGTGITVESGRLHGWWINDRTAGEEAREAIAKLAGFVGNQDVG